MRETTLLKIALISGIAGLILLLGVLETTPSKEVSISDIRTEDIRGSVLIRGKISRIAVHNDTQFLDLLDDDPFTVMVTRDDAIPIKVGQHVEVRGRIEDSNGKKQFTGEEVRII